MRPLDIHRRYFDLKVMLIIIFMILFIFATARSQSQDVLSKHKYFSMGINGLAAVPLGDFFYESNQILAWGIQGTILYHPRKINKCYLGFGFSYYNYGIEKYQQEEEIDGIIYDFTTHRNYNIYFPCLNIRLVPWEKSRILPVFDAFLGPRAFSTASIYSYEEDPGFIMRLFGADTEEKVVRNVELKDWTCGYGFSVGINYIITSVLGFEMTLSYTKGGEANYLTKSDIDRDPVTGNFTYFPRRSETDLLVVGFGIRINPI